MKLDRRGSFESDDSKYVFWCSSLKKGEKVEDKQDRPTLDMHF